ncbi:MAG: DUF123 domain-containing protein [Candidatus Thorarchaeota archaeon]
MILTMKGAYCLIIDVEKDLDLEIQSLGKIRFQSGIWVYIGSAMGNSSTSLENRIRRHFQSQKKIYWHIDYLLALDVKLIKAFWTESPVHIECDIAQEIQKRNEFQTGPKNFGSSDCQKGCSAHIFRFLNIGEIDKVIRQTFTAIDIEPSITIDGNL